MLQRDLILESVGVEFVQEESQAPQEQSFTELT